MPLRAALRALHEARTDEIVLTAMGPAREWQAISKRPLDFSHAPSCMGHTSALGFGLALAQPKRHVIVLNGDGSMLMSLGNLVTIAAASRTHLTPALSPEKRRSYSAASNFTLIVCDNGVYEVTGRQRTPGGAVDFAGLARAAGFDHVWKFDGLDAWRAAVRDVLKSPGPRFVHLRTEPLWDEKKLAVPMPETMPEQIARLRAGLG
jgi:thiamine pyrophosphate-dependent acetolactate synthase large subunit-like protein